MKPLWAGLMAGLIATYAISLAVLGNELSLAREGRRHMTEIAMSLAESFDKVYRIAGKCEKFGPPIGE